MTSAIFILLGLILYKVFFSADASKSVSNTDSNSYTVQTLKIDFDKNKIKDFSNSDNQLAIMGPKSEIVIFDKNTGKIIGEYRFEEK